MQVRADGAGAVDPGEGDGPRHLGETGAGDAAGTGPGEPGGAAGPGREDSGPRTEDGQDDGRAPCADGDEEHADDHKAGSRRPPVLTTDTALPEGGGRAAPGDAPAPARQWPLLAVLSPAGVGLLMVGTNAFADAFRVGTMLIGAGLILGAVLRRVTPSVGMLAVRSRFTDMITYGLLGTVIVLLALVAQPKPWLDVPFLEGAVHFTVR